MIEEIADREDIESPIVRIRVQGGGCAGFQYDMSFLSEDEKQTIGEMDECWEMDGFDVIIDPISLQYLEDVTVDYVVSPQGEGFKFLNSQAVGQCGCGKSFSV